MQVDEIYDIHLGGRSTKYIVTGVFFNQSVELRRLIVPKTKIDAVGLPISIRIAYFGTAVPDKKEEIINTK